MRISPAPVLILIALTGTAYAGAWTQEAGRSQLILTGAYYRANERWDNSGRRLSQPAYDKYELNPYYEYGWRDGITLGANLSFQRAQMDGAGASAAKTSWGIGDSEFFMRKRLWQRGGFIVSAEPMVKLPSFWTTGRNNPRIGSSQPDAGMGISAGYGFKVMGHDAFTDINAQYRYRFGRQKDQLRFAATAGLYLTDRWMVMPQGFVTGRVSKPQNAAFTESPDDDYSAVRLQLSAVYRLNADTSLQFGGFGDLYGKNTGVGRGILFSVWKQL